MNGNVLQNLLTILKPLFKQGGVVSGSLGSVYLVASPHYKDMYEEAETSVIYPRDKRRNILLELFYNPRQLTLSFATLLHELGHIFNTECPTTYETDRTTQDPHETFEEELEAWVWARRMWKYVPLRTRWPMLYELYCIQTYETFDPFVDIPNHELLHQVYNDEKQMRLIDAKKEKG